jgi:hypothetical protein
VGRSKPTRPICDALRHESGATRREVGLLHGLGNTSPPIWSAVACYRFRSDSLLPSASTPGGARREQAPSSKAAASSRTPYRVCRFGNTVVLSDNASTGRPLSRADAILQTPARESACQPSHPVPRAEEHAGSADSPCSAWRICARRSRILDALRRECCWPRGFSKRPALPLVPGWTTGDG